MVRVALCRSLHVGLHYRDAGCHHVLRPSHRAMREPAWQEAFAAHRFWSSSDPRASLHTDPQHRKPDRYPTPRRRRKRNLRCRLNPRGSGQNPCHGPLQSRSRQSSDSGRARRSSQHDVRREADTALQLPNLFPVIWEPIAVLAFALLWTAIPETLTHPKEPDKHTSSPITPQELQA